MVVARIGWQQEISALFPGVIASLSKSKLHRVHPLHSSNSKLYVRTHKPYHLLGAMNLVSAQFRPDADTCGTTMLPVLVVLLIANACYSEARLAANLQLSRKLSSSRCGPLKLQIRDGANQSISNTFEDVNGKDETATNAPINVNARGIPCSSRCCSYNLQLRSGTGHVPPGNTTLMSWTIVF